MGRYCRVSLVVLLALSLGSTAHAQAGDVLITAGKLLNVRTGKLLSNPQVLVRKGHVVGIKSAPDAFIVAADMRRIDLPGLTLLPGLIDMHVHLDTDPAYGGYTDLQFSDRFWSMLSVPHAAKTLAAGFTAVRNVGSEEWNDVGLREAIDEGKIPGPRVVPAGYAFGATGGHCDSTFFPGSVHESGVYTVDSPAEGRKRVREVRKHGAQVIKICATGGVFTQNSDPEQQQLSLAEMQAIVEEAHQWGMKVAAHAHGASGIREAIRAGVDTIEHASLIDAEGIRLAKKSGTWLSMDIYNTDYTQSEGVKNGDLEDSLRKDRELGDRQRENFRLAHAAGVRMLYGTDAGIYPHGDNARQFAVMVRYGMTPVQAIQSATINSAEALGRKDLGVIEAGRWADMIAVAGDPTTNVRLLESVPVVIKGGVIVKDAR